jgi:hypothetical protein
MRRSLAALFAILVAAAPLGAGETKVTIEADEGKWESGYGVKFYNVVGTLKNGGTTPVAWVKLRIEALDARGAVVATMDGYNETAEALSAPDADVMALVAAGKVTPIAPGATQRFRASFLADEHPDIASHRITVAEAPPP